ncbi:MAG: membrane protein [Bacteroidetes bacterium 4572_77]|nr:MAG: membrane protein [Bacteroidetes bacterium 4572_77]
MSFVTIEKLFSLEWFKVYGLILTGTFIMSAGFVFFISPYKLAPGGVYGIAIMLHHLFGLPIGIMGLALDIPLTLIGVKILGPRFGIKTIVGFVSTSLWITMLELLWGYEPLVHDEPLLSSLYGGGLIGVGLGMVFKARATSGGTDILAMILAKYTKKPVGQLLILVDSIVVIGALVAFGDWKIPLLSWLVILLTGKIIDAIVEGTGYDKSVMIISDKHDLIRDKIINDLNRGGTYIRGRGMYNNKEKEIIMTVINRREVLIIKNFIRKIDSEAFIMVSDTNEIMGDGFKSLHED